MSRYTKKETIKNLDSYAFEYVHTAVSKGESYLSIIPKLRAMGYTSPLGYPVESPTLSKFMRAKGFKRYKSIKSTKATASTSVVSIVAKPIFSTPASTIAKEEDFILDVLTHKTLSKNKKLKILAALMED